MINIVKYLAAVNAGEDKGKALLYSMGYPIFLGGGGDKIITEYLALAEIEAKRIIKVVSKITPIQAGSGDPSPTNVRPISGYDELELWHTKEYPIIEDSVPYIFRASGGRVKVGKKSYDTLIGGSVGWNQLIKLTNYTESLNGITFTRSTDGTVTVSGTATADAYKPIASSVAVNVGHVYLDHYGIKSVSGEYRVGDFNNGNSFSYTDTGKVTKYTSAGNIVYGVQVYSGKTVNLSFKPMLIDLTLLLGSTIADYIYSLESATAGAGIAKLREWGFIGDAYIPYDAGSIKSVGASAKVTRDASDNIIGNYPLDSSLTLRGIPKLTDGKLWYDGDRYESDGTVTRRYGVVDLGTLNWGYVSTEGHKRFTATLATASRSITNLERANIISSRYMADTFGHVFNNVTDKTISITPNGLQTSICDEAYTDPTAFKTAMSGVMLVYELATPTTESASPFMNPQIVDPDGTEEYVTGNGVPVGHESKYFDGEVITIKLNNTIYAGIWDVIKGELTVLMQMVDLGTLNWTLRTEYTDRSHFETQLLDGTRGATDMICSMFATYAGIRATAPNLSVFKGNLSDSRTLMIRDDSYTDAATFKAAMSGVQLLYELAEPYIIHVDPHKLTAYGTDYIWSNSGDVQVTYKPNN